MHDEYSLEKEELNLKLSPEILCVSCPFELDDIG